MKTATQARRKWMLAGLAFLLLLVLSGVCACRYRSVPLAHPGARSINELRQVELGGLRQWVSIRGSDVRNPVLLFLHGGPGSANLAKLRIQCPDLEDHFLVVSWDQRGAGKTYTLRTGADDLTLEQLREDARQLVEYLRGRFEGRQLFLMGFSWGSVLGVLTVRDHPEDFLAYIGVGQVVQYAEGEKISLEYARRKAFEINHAKALEELRGIDPAYRSPDWYDSLMRQRHWLLEFGGVYHTAGDYGHELRMLLEASEYSLVDFAWWPLGSGASLRKLWPELMGVDLFEEAPRLDVPVYFLSGRYDHNAPWELTQTYYQQLQAPQGKRLIGFEESAHDIFFDQPDELMEEVIRVKAANFQDADSMSVRRQ